MLVENYSNHIVTKMFLTYTIITEKSLIKQKNMVRCRVKRQKSISKIMVKNNSEVQNFSYFFTSISNNYFFLQKFIPSIFLELLDIGACDFLIPPLLKNESCEKFSHNF